MGSFIDTLGKYTSPSYRYVHEKRRRENEVQRKEKRKVAVAAENLRIKTHNAGLGKGGYQPGVAAATLTSSGSYPGASVLR